MTSVAQWAHWVLQGLSFAKQWTGMVGLVILLLLVVAEAGCTLYRRSQQQQHQQQLLMQAVLALHRKDSPEIWLNMLDQ